MGERGAFGCARRAARELDVDGIVELEQAGARAQPFDARVIRQARHVVERQDAG